MATSALASRLEASRKAQANLRAKNNALETQALQHVIAMGGGVAGALAGRFLPGVVPGDAADSLAVLATTLLVDGAAMYSGSPEMLAFAFAYEGKVVGDAFDSAMGWMTRNKTP